MPINHFGFSSPSSRPLAAPEVTPPHVPDVTANSETDVFESIAIQRAESMDLTEIQDYFPRENIQKTFSPENSLVDRFSQQVLQTMRAIADHNRQDIEEGKEFYLFQRGAQNLTLEEALRTFQLQGSVCVKTGVATRIGDNFSIENRDGSERTLYSAQDLIGFWRSEQS